MSHVELENAKVSKKDDFFTSYEDIEKEIEVYLKNDPTLFQNKGVILPCNDDVKTSNFALYFKNNFIRLGLRKLWAVSFQPSWSRKHGRVFIIERKRDEIVKQDLTLDGKGDFNSPEITNFRDQADFIITNPPFSQFRPFMKWVLESHARFLILGNLFAVGYKEIFPFIKENKLWLGLTIHGGDREFQVPDTYPLNAKGSRIDEKGKRYIRVKGVRWFTNLDHPFRHVPIKLNLSLADLKKPGIRKPDLCFEKYDNYEAIEISGTKLLPNDYIGVMGVPLNFLDKYCPDQFEIVGFRKGTNGRELSIKGFTPFSRILIRRKNATV